MAAQPSQGGDHTPGGIWIAALIIVAALAIWYAWHTQIVTWVFHIKWFEAKALSYLFPDVQHYMAFMIEMDPHDVTVEQLYLIGDAIGRYLRYPLIIVLAVGALILYRFDLQSRFSKVYSTQSLAEQEVKIWPQITPALALNLVKQNITEGAWAMAMTPIEFAQTHQLLESHEQQVTVKKDMAKEAFIGQLGPLWTGVDDLKPHQQALLAVFIARMNRDRDGAVKLLNAMAHSSNQERLDCSGCHDLLKAYWEQPQIQTIIGQHAYVLTVMASLLELARLDGVLASADFLWLKPRDRLLWYMLNSVGRQTPYIEIAGAFSHWQAEKSLGNRLRIPMVAMAVEGLVVAMAETKHNLSDAAGS